MPYWDSAKGDIPYNFAPNTSAEQFGLGLGSIRAGGNVSVQTSHAGIGNGADTSEDTLFTFTLPANTLDAVGREVCIQAWGSVAATSATKTAKIYFGSTVLTTFTATTTQSGVWCICASIVKDASNSQNGAVLNDTTITGSLVRSMTITTPTEADTAGIVIKVTGQSSVATANLVTCNSLIVSGFN